MFFVFELDMNSSFLILIAFFYMDPSILIISQPDKHPPINYHSPVPFYYSPPGKRSKGLGSKKGRENFKTNRKSWVAEES
jgi:hypothetical protein